MWKHLKIKSIVIEERVMRIEIEGWNLVRLMLGGLLEKISFKLSLKYWKGGHMGNSILCRINRKFKAHKWECVWNGWGFKKTISAMMKHVAWSVGNEEWEAEEVGAIGQHWVLLLLFPFIQWNFWKMEVVPKFLSKTLEVNIHIPLIWVDLCSPFYIFSWYLPHGHRSNAIRKSNYYP